MPRLGDQPLTTEPYGVDTLGNATGRRTRRATRWIRRPRSWQPVDDPVRTAGLSIDRALRDAPDTVAELIRERPDRYNAEAAAVQSGASELTGRVCQLAPPADVRPIGPLEARPHRLVEAIRLSATVYHTIAPYLTPARTSNLNGRVEAAA